MVLSGEDFALAREQSRARAPDGRFVVGIHEFSRSVGFSVAENETSGGGGGDDNDVDFGGILNSRSRESFLSRRDTNRLSSDRSSSSNIQSKFTKRQATE